MTVEELDKLKDARDKLAEVYESQATDDLPDNGNLNHLHNGLINVNNAIVALKKQLPPEEE